jgi:hypothetical protein
MSCCKEHNLVSSMRFGGAIGLKTISCPETRDGMFEAISLCNMLAIVPGTRCVRWGVVLGFGLGKYHGLDTVTAIRKLVLATQEVISSRIQEQDGREQVQQNPYRLQLKFKYFNLPLFFFDVLHDLSVHNPEDIACSDECPVILVFHFTKQKRCLASNIT